MRISASQLDTFAGDQGCNRKWWLTRVLKLKDIPRGYFIFGTVLHGCIERWLSSDSLGRVPDSKDVVKQGESLVHTKGPLIHQVVGAPVDPFPIGWETVVENGKACTISPNEIRLIRDLFQQAIERGLIRHWPGVQVEREFSLPVLDGVDLVGFVDVALPAAVNGAVPEIHDHKTFSESGSRFLKQQNPESPNWVGKNQQLKTYAAALSKIDGWTGPVRVRHNQFPKYEDHKGPRMVDGEVSAADLEAHWTWIQETAEKMVRVSKIERWEDVPGPATTDVCSAFGGCQFQRICSRLETTQVYSQRVQRMLEQSSSNSPNVSLAAKKQKKKSMSNGSNDVFAKARAKQAQRSANQAAAKPTEQTQQAVQELGVAPGAGVQQAPAASPINGGAAPAARAPATTNPPPWADPSCAACRGVGFTSKGGPCPICDNIAKRNGRVMSNLYAVHKDEVLGRVAQAIKGAEEKIRALGAPLEWSEKGEAKFGQPMSSAAAEESAPESPVVAGTSAAAQPSVKSPQFNTKKPSLAFPSEHAAYEAAKEKASEQPKAAAPVKESLASATQPEPDGTHNPQPDSTPAASERPLGKTEKMGRPRLGCTILIGCSMLKGPARETVLIQVLLEELGAELAQAMGAASYWELDPFKRRDRLRQRAAEIAEKIGKKVLLVPNIADPDAAALVAALAPHSDMVIEGLR